MARRLRTWLVALGLLAVTLTLAAPAAAEIAPPWCGTPEPDAAENLPDGTDPADPPGSFPHIPYYAIGCTLDAIEAQSGGRMTVEVVGRSATGRDMYLVVINALDTPQRQQDFHAWEQIRKVALTDPARAHALLQSSGDNVKIPLYIQGGIHGNEYEGVDSNMRVIEKLATTPYGADPDVDAILDHAVVVFNVIQNPDGRVAGTRANGNGFDLNRDFLTQSQSETLASVQIMQEWIPPDMLDLHGYLEPMMLIEATTKPHNPSIEYDMWLKWNQARIDANEAALNAAGYEVQRPINDWCSDADLPPCPPGETPGPEVAEGWDDWGPFYTPMYAQHVAMNGSTVEMCSLASCGGRAGALEQQEITTLSTLTFNVGNRADVLFDELEIYRRGVTDAPRPACCPPPFDIDNNWMLEYPKAYVIPVGEGQRSDPEANRLVVWLLFNGVEVDELKQDYTLGSQTFRKGSYVVWMAQARRGLIDTALGIGVDVSPRINILYAPPAAWSHGYLWGADIATIPDAAVFSPQTNRVLKPSFLLGGVEPGTASRYVLEVDSPTAVRTLNRLVGNGISAQLALTAFSAPTGGTFPAGSVIFPADQATKVALAAAGRESGVWFRRLTNGSLPAVDPIEGVPRIAVLVAGAAAALNQSVWSLRNLGFAADPVPTGSASALNNAAGPNPLDGYDVVFNTITWPAANAPTSRARLTAFFNGGGGYIGAMAAGASFLSAANSGQLPGLATGSSTGGGQSGIFYWQNAGGAASVIVGAYPSQDTAIMDPPTWFSTVPAGATVDGRLLGDTTSTFAAGLWRFPRTAPANAPIIVHAPAAAAGSTARVTAFAMNPLYRADPEREWPMVSEAAYWADQ
ncbi:MAG: M14 family zinc carboxypeptidase [Gaiellaceae bacterium]